MLRIFLNPPVARSQKLNSIENYKLFKHIITNEILLQYLRKIKPKTNNTTP